jgi:hypothetical protein
MSLFKRKPKPPRPDLGAFTGIGMLIEGGLDCIAYMVTAIIVIVILSIGGCAGLGYYLYHKGKADGKPMQAIITTNQVVSTNFVPYIQK